jgi:hypothetical protein
MKHLKLYENSRFKENEYFIYKNNDNLFTIFQILNVNGTSVEIVRKYEYSKIKDTLEKDNLYRPIIVKLENGNLNNNKILYISNKLQDCVETLYMIDTINKFNL